MEFPIHERQCTAACMCGVCLFDEDNEVPTQLQFGSAAALAMLNSAAVLAMPSENKCQ